MRRARATFLVTVVSAFALGGAQPVQAHTDVCSGVGVLNWLPATSSFSMSLTAGTCGAGTGLGVVGTLSGTCTNASGSGTTSSGHPFLVQWTSGQMAWTGGATGSWTANPLGCATGQWDIAGSVALTTH